MGYLPESQNLADNYAAELTGAWFQITYYGASREQAEAAARVLGAKRVEVLGGASHTYMATVRGNLRSVKGNERNETGIARYRRTMARLDAAGITVEVFTGAGIRWYRDENPYMTRDAFEAALAA